MCRIFLCPTTIRWFHDLNFDWLIEILTELAYGEKVKSIKKFNWPGYEVEEIQSRQAQRDIAEQSEIFLDNDDDLEMDFIEPPKGHWDPHDTREPPSGQNKKGKTKGSNIAFENFFK